MTPEEKQQFEELKQTVENLKAATDPTFIEAIKEYSGMATVEVSGKGADSEDIVINEAGSATNTVIGDPVGFVTIGGYNIPYY